jgi:uncharacterized protein (TIGR02328 family)
MRCWHKDIVNSLPELQLKSQWRECVLIAKDLHETGFTHHLLINQIMNYNREHFNAYLYLVYRAMIERGYRLQTASLLKLKEYLGFEPYVKPEIDNIWSDWHNKEYLRVCMANLYEKHVFGVGKSRITDEEWQRLVDGYRQITGEEYQI